MKYFIIMNVRTSHANTIDLSDQEEYLELASIHRNK